MNKKEMLESPYIGCELHQDYALLYSRRGDFSVILKIKNPVEQYSADIESYYDFHYIMSNIIKIVGAGCSIQKQDILSKQTYKVEKQTGNYLTDSYFKHFEGREYTKLDTYLIITGENLRNKFFAYDDNKFKSFLINVRKIQDFLDSRKITNYALNRDETIEYLYRFFSLSFDKETFSFDNIKARKNQLNIGEKKVKCISLVNIEEVEMPTQIKPFKVINVANRDFPVDTFNFLYKVPNVDLVIYNQLIQIPDQRKEINKLEAKRKKHSSMPDPANELCVEDIDKTLSDIAREGQLLVYTFNNIIISSKGNLQTAFNFIESSMFEVGIIVSKQTYNQFELFMSSLPANVQRIKAYDKFLTTSDAALCLMFKEYTPISDDSDFICYLTDRQGIPLGVDISDLPVHQGRTNNRNKFILGPSGSGKSFYTNSMLRQYFDQNADIVIVDTGHSYSGLCKRCNGKYITYTEEKPITMNPFRIRIVEYNEEKREFLKSLIALIWKGSDGSINQVEDTLLSNVISSYYNNYFHGIGFTGYTDKEKEDIRISMLKDWETDTDNNKPSKEEILKKIEAHINEEENKLLSQTKGEKRVESLSFNSFYDYAIVEIERIIETEKIHFDLNTFKYVLKKFYKGGDFERILNDDFDNTLFDETFIVFEIDAIKEHKILFPIVTLIIMDVFLQKMRLKPNRKVLCIEEAWKALASPIMAGYILYLYKTVRKFYGEAIVVTQELDDIIGNEIVKNSIINNSDATILLDQTKFKDNYKDISSLLSLSEVEQSKIFTINNLDNKDNRPRFKEVYIKMGAWGSVYGVEVSPQEYFTFTTEKIEKDAMSKYREIEADFEKSLESFINDLQLSKLKNNEFCMVVNSSLFASMVDSGMTTRSIIEKVVEDLQKTRQPISDYLRKTQSK